MYTTLTQKGVCMNLLLKSMSVLLLSTITLSAKSSCELNILNLDHLPCEASDILALKEQITQQDPSIICIFKNVIDFIKNSCEIDFGKDFPFVLQSEDNQCVILSKYELSHFKLHDLGPDNTILEFASHEIPNLILNAHLPHYSQQQLDTLKSYLIATTHYVNLYMTGDLADNKYLTKNYEYLILPCGKGKVSSSVEKTPEGEKKTEVKVSYKSDNNRHNLSGKVGASQDSQSNGPGCGSSSDKEKTKTYGKIEYSYEIEF